MKKVSIFIAIVTTIVLLTNCKKDDTSFDSYFYTRVPDSKTQLSLFLNDKNKGSLPHLEVPEMIYPMERCNNDTIKQNGLFLTLTEGKYTVSAKDQEGNIKSSQTVKVSKGGIKVTPSIGKSEMAAGDNCFILDLYFD
jgi:hypothetical protein